MTLKLHKSQFAVLVSFSREIAVHLIRSFGCRYWLRKSGANCSTVSLCCVTITWQHIFEGSLQVAVVAVLPLVMKQLNADILAGNAARQRLLIVVSHVRSYQWWENCDIFCVVLLARSMVVKVVDIDAQGSIGPSKGSINSHGVEWGSLNG